MKTNCIKYADSNFEVKKSIIHGRGVFAKRHFKGGDIVAVADVLVIPNSVNTLLPFYTFPWSGKDKTCCICMHPITFANHSDMPNITIDSIDKESMTKTFKALVDINSGDELLLYYNKNFKMDCKPIDSKKYQNLMVYL